ncbi:MAG: ferric reductase-like transmembrane domain-containing protein [Candidatus Saccharimonadales bacterium]
MAEHKMKNLLGNSRFYILVSSVLLSIIIAAYIRLQIPSDQLYYIRIQQLFGLFAIIYWLLALVISPIGYVIGKQRMKHLGFARRAIGVSAAYFATLHGAVALWGQLGGLSALALLPPLFQWSIAGGAIGLFILLIMAATSFDKVISFMTFTKWKWLHRLVYIGFILVCLHIWTIGTHLAYMGVQWTAFTALVILSGLELFRTIKLVNDKYLHFEKREMITLFGASWVIIIFLISLTPVFVQNYYSKHESHSEEHTVSTEDSHSEAHNE